MTARAWADAVGRFDQHLATTGRSPATREGYVKHVSWLAASAATGPWDVTTAQLSEWLGQRNWSRETRRKVLVSLRRFYAWATAEAFLEWAPTAGLPSAAPNKRGPQRARHSAAWEAAIDAFLAWCRAGARSQGTVEQRRWWLGRLAEVCADPWQVTPDQLALWLSNPDWSPETKRAGRSTVRSFYAWAVKTGHAIASPAADLDAVLVPRALPRPAPAEAVRAALTASDDRTRVAVKLALYAGLRRAEIASLHGSQIGPTELLVSGKGGHERRVPLHPDLAGELHAELARRRRGEHGSGWSGKGLRDDGWLFPSSHGGHLTPHHLGKLVSAALPAEWTTHTLRHRFATSAYAATRDLRAVQELLGHAKPETTARYAAVPDGALQAAVRGLGDFA